METPPVTGIAGCTGECAAEAQSQRSVAEDCVPVDTCLLITGFPDTQNFHIQHHLALHFFIAFFNERPDRFQYLWGCP
ncbi:Uncharacterised protein [Escherichia coli]|uniref:Uncharacterized protein n=1 Tax=Escherichia coli TaxID=562 RepID=A0A2X1L514_ECOLX|nr:Uncharacterised protein [Escherichia coli]